MGIYEKLNAIRSAKADICQAIMDKNPSVQPTDDIRQWPAAIASISGGSSHSVSPNNVVFRDYDGKILYSYSKTEIASLVELPSLPTREGLTCQGWNWTLPQIKDYVASYGKCEIGAVYTTDDGKTRIKITIQDPKYTIIPIVFLQTVANGVKVNWGDGSADQTYSSVEQQTISHTYAPTTYPATYTITFEVTSGTMSFPTYIMDISSQSTASPRDAFLSMIDEVNIGNDVTDIGDHMFAYCYSLASVTIPSSVTSIGTQVFQYCYSLASITIPSSVTSIGNGAFQYCYSLASITIPSSVTSIGGIVFQQCRSLVSITIPSSVTSIENNTFHYCCSLASITIPSSVTSIGTQAFHYCFGLKTFDFRRSTSVPTLSNVNTFQNTPTTKEIIVPDELYDDWIAASNWSSSTNQIKESIVKASESSLGPL